MDDRDTLFSLIDPTNRSDIGAVLDAFGPARLTQARFAADLSEANLAEDVDVTPPAIGRYESRTSARRGETFCPFSRESSRPRPTTSPLGDGRVRLVDGHSHTCGARALGQLCVRQLLERRGGGGFRGCFRDTSRT